MLFAKVDLPLLDKKQATADILAVKEDLWFWDKYRGTSMLPLMTKGGLEQARGASNGRQGDFVWTSYAPTVVKNWFDNIVFPWMGMQTRVMALKTKPGIANLEHIDCDPHNMGSQQHKFRVVIQGNVATLYFKTQSGDQYVPMIEESFIMDGSWPHGMVNTTDELKLTLAAGAPWHGNQKYDNIAVLMKRSDYKMPTDLEKFFNKPR